MTETRITKIAQKNHQRLLDSVLPLPGSVDASLLHIGDAEDGDFPHRREDRKVILRNAETAAIRAMGPASHVLDYPPDNVRCAADALIAASTSAGQPIAGDPAMLAVLTLAQRVAASSIPILVEGPTGTGKEVLARFIHNASPRREAPFLAINCAAMPETMLEGLLFGHRKGAFTGANEAQEGFFRAADGGTLLLDEIGEMPLALQAKLLRVLQEGEVVPLGATEPVKVDVRIVACTNRDLPTEIGAGRFREDLYYRLNVFPLRIPALRERPDDIAPLAFGMLLRHGCSPGQSRWIAQNALARLQAHTWPGNVRELENVMRRAILLAGDENTIVADHISFDQRVRAVDPIPASAEAQISHIPREAEPSLSDIAFQSEAQAILRTLDECGGKRAETARRLGISERTLRYRLADMREAGVAVAGART